MMIAAAFLSCGDAFLPKRDMGERRHIAALMMKRHARAHYFRADEAYHYGTCRRRWRAR